MRPEILKELAEFPLQKGVLVVTYCGVSGLKPIQDLAGQHNGSKTWICIDYEHEEGNVGAKFGLVIPTVGIALSSLIRIKKKCDLNEVKCLSEPLPVSEVEEVLRYLTDQRVRTDEARKSIALQKQSLLPASTAHGASGGPPWKVTVTFAPPKNRSTPLKGIGNHVDALPPKQPVLTEPRSVKERIGALTAILRNQVDELSQIVATSQDELVLLKGELERITAERDQYLTQVRKFQDLFNRCKSLVGP